jgi:cold shock CspA family protein
VQQHAIVLGAAPKKITKRIDRIKFDKEILDDTFTTGILKFYNKKKRFGFIAPIEDKGGDVFLCEDDIIISGINLKDFKDRVTNQDPATIRFSFHIKVYEEKGRTKRKAVDVTLI